MNEPLVITKRIKDYIKGDGLLTSAKVIEELTLAVEDLIKKGILNAKDEGRKTAMGRDIIWKD